LRPSGAKSGFHALGCEDRFHRYRGDARRELSNLNDLGGRTFASRYGDETQRDEIEFFEVTVEVTDLDAQRPGHLRAQRP